MTIFSIDLKVEEIKFVDNLRFLFSNINIDVDELIGDYVFIHREIPPIVYIPSPLGGPTSQFCLQSTILINAKTLCYVLNVINNSPECGF